MFLAVYNVAWFIFQVFMCRQGFTLKYTTGTKFRRCFYTTVCVICFTFCKTGEEQCAVWGPASFQRAPMSISMCALTCVWVCVLWMCVLMFFLNRNEWFFACEKLPLCEQAACTCVYVHVRSKLWGSQGGRPVVSSRMYLHLKLQGQD